MKKFLLYAALGLCTAAAAIAIYRYAFRKSIPDAEQNEQVMAILRQNDCFVCHSATPQLPFYASLPVIGDQMREHCVHATDFCDLEARLANLDEADDAVISMLDHAISYGTMPIAEYRLIHWGTGFNSRETAVLNEWINQKRGYAGAICPIPASLELDEAKVEMGRRLFLDNRISLDGTLNCATCHILEIGGADHHDVRTSEGINGLHGGVNAPTVYNAGFQIRQFWNGRAADLREQAEGPATNPVEMGDQTWDDIVARLSKDKALVKEMEALFPGEGLTRQTVTLAIAEFEKSLITPGCRFDLYLQGDENALNEQEKQGYALFLENSCAACHTGVAMGGRSFEHPFIYGDYFADRDESIAYNGDDDGLRGFSGKAEDLHKYKVPMLRNIALTAPYFHDGTQQSLEEAVEAMGEYTLNKEFSAEEELAIVAFLRTLTGHNQYLTEAE